jgi:nucleoside-diphosphate-sugar epimerase
VTLRAVIAGATGLIGSNLAAHFVSKGWEVCGIARKSQGGITGVRPIAADLLAAHHSLSIEESRRRDSWPASARHRPAPAAAANRGRGSLAFNAVVN